MEALEHEPTGQDMKKLKRGKGKERVLESTSTDVQDAVTELAKVDISKDVKQKRGAKLKSWDERQGKANRELSGMRLSAETTQKQAKQMIEERREAVRLNRALGASRSRSRHGTGRWYCQSSTDSDLGHEDEEDMQLETASEWEPTDLQYGMMFGRYSTFHYESQAVLGMTHFDDRGQLAGGNEEPTSGGTTVREGSVVSSLVGWSERSNKRMRLTDDPTVYKPRSSSGISFDPSTELVNRGNIHEMEQSMGRSNFQLEDDELSSRTSNGERASEEPQVTQDQQVLVPEQEPEAVNEEVMATEHAVENVMEPRSVAENEQAVEPAGVGESEDETDDVVIGDGLNGDVTEHDEATEQELRSTLPQNVQCLLRLPIQLLGRGDDSGVELYDASLLSNQLRYQLWRSLHVICEGKPELRVTRFLNSKGPKCLAGYMITGRKPDWSRGYAKKMACKECIGKRPCVLLQGLKHGDLSLLFLPHCKGPTVWSHQEHWLPNLSSLDL